MQRMSRLIASVLLPFVGCANVTPTPETPNELLQKNVSQSEQELALQGLRADDATAKIASAQLISMGESVIPALKGN